MEETKRGTGTEIGRKRKQRAEISIADENLIGNEDGRIVKGIEKKSRKGPPFEGQRKRLWSVNAIILLHYTF